MSGSLLRRPLPSTRKRNDGHKERKTSNNSNSIPSKRVTVLPAIKDIKNCKDFDIYDDGDQNLMKPLGPEPFFPKKGYNLQWITKYQNTSKTRNVVGVIPDFSYPFDELEPEEGDASNVAKYVFEDKYPSLEKTKGTRQEAINVIDLDNKDIPLFNERKPWRHALLEEEAKHHTDIFEQISKANLLELTNKSSSLIAGNGAYEGVEDHPHSSADPTSSSKQTSPMYRKYPSTIKKSLSRSMELARKLMIDNLPSVLKDDVLLEKEEDNFRDWTSLYEVMREELQNELLSMQHSPTEQPTAYDDIIWKEEYDKETATNQTKLNLKAQFLEVIPDLPPRLIDVLTWVNLSFNDFMEVPEPLLQAKNVIYLNMRNNPLLSIPDGISNLKKMRYLNFSFCYLQEVNPRLFDLHELEVLDLSFNDIRRLDNQCKNFRCLRELVLEGNRIRCLPRGFLQLNLSHLQISSNFLAKSFWRETCPIAIQSLTELCIDTLLNNEMLAKESVESLLSIHISTGSCDYCNGPISMGGIDVIKPVTEIFGAKHLPILFNVCSPTCRKQLLAASNVPRFEDANQESLNG